jgi:probable rRNA maturation factor
MIAPKPEIHLFVQYATHVRHALPTRAHLRRLVRACAEKDLQLTIRFVDKDEALALNSDFRHKAYATNVLTFVYENDKQKAVGDIVICAPVIAEEARAQKKLLAHHYAHMVVHGGLHVQGYEHEAEAEAEHMEALEAKILRRFRIMNPYA